MGEDYIYSKPPLGSLIDLEESINNELRGWWLMQESVGSHVNDISGNGNHGVLTNEAGWTAGKFGPALTFDPAGNADYVAIPGSASLDTPDGLTVSAWVYYSGTGSEAVVARRINAATQMFFVRWNSDDTIQFQVDDLAKDSFNVTTVASFPTQRWTHIVATVHPATTTGRIYVDGQLIEEETSFVTSLYVNPAAQMFIGKLQSSSDVQPWTGKVDNVQIWDREVQPVEVLQLNSQPFKGVLSWP